MTEDFARADDTQLAQANAGGSQAQDAVTVFQPPNGGEILLQTVAGQVYDLQFDPRLAEVRVIDVDGDQDLDVALVFNAGTAEESRIVFKDMVDAAQSGNPPVLQIGDAQFGADVMVQQAQALAGGQPTLETAAPSGQEAEGTGVTEYDDNLGNLIDLLDPQGVIPPTELVLLSLEPTVAEDALIETASADATVGNVPVATAGIGATNGAEDIVVKEDSSLGDAANDVTITADVTDGVLITIVISGFDPSWTYDFSGLGTVTDNVAGDGTVTLDLTGLGLTSFSGSFEVQPPADTDVDLGTLTLTANGQSTVDPTLTGSDVATADVAVDAVLDEAPAVTQSSVPEVDESTSGAQTILLGFVFSMTDAGYTGSPFGGSDTDGSESVTSVTINLSDGTLVLDAGYAGSASLAEKDGGNWTLSGWADLSDLVAAVEAFSVTVGEGFDGTVTGTVSTMTQEANTPEGTVPTSGDEPDDLDNIANGSFDFSLIVDSLPTVGDLAIAVDDDDLPSGNSDVAAGDDLPDPSPTAIMGTLDLDFGADAASGMVDFAALDTLAVLDTDSNPVTSGAVPLVYSWNAGTDTLTALAGATSVFTVVVTDPSTGAFTFALLDSIDHPTTGTEDNLTIAMSFTATDGEGDMATGTLIVNIDDDVPESFSPEALEMANPAGGSSDTGNLDTGGKGGADGPASIVFSGVADGDLLVGSIAGEDPKALTSNGQPIVLDVSEDGQTLIGFINLDGEPDEFDGNDIEVIRISLQPGTDQYTVTLSQMIDNGQQIAFDNFSDVRGNNKVFLPISSSDASALEDLLITATVPGTSTVNNDNDDIGSGDQWLNNDDTPADGEIIRLDYVENVAGDPDDMSTLSYTQHYVAIDAGFRVNQLQGNSAISRSVLVRVYDEHDNPQGLDFATMGAGDLLEQDDIVSARVEVGAETFEAAYDGLVFDGVANVFNDSRITFTFNPDGSVEIDGLLELDQVFVSTDNGFTQMEIQNITSGGKLGIALDNFLIGVQQTGDTIDISAEVTLTDSDGDAVSSTIDVTLLPQLTGDSSDNVLTSNGDAEILVGGLGDDTLTGGGEADKFVFNLGVDDGDDTITDFMSAEDILKFTDVANGAGDDIQDVDDMITSIVDDGSGDVQVNFTNGGSIDFEGIAFAAQTSIADLVDTNAQVVVDHV